MESITGRRRCNAETIAPYLLHFCTYGAARDNACLLNYALAECPLFENAQAGVNVANWRKAEAHC